MTQRSNPSSSGTVGSGGFNVDKVREEFPALWQTVHGKPLVYLDNAATTQKPRVVLETLQRYYERDNANVHRGLHTLSQRATEAFEAARKTVQRFLNAEHPEEIVFLRGTTEAINLVAQSFLRRHLSVGPGDEILITEMEHHSNIVPWQLVCEETGCRLRVAPISDAGNLDLDAFERLLSERTRLVAFAHVSNVLGTVNPVRELVAMARRVGAAVLIDGAQAAPHLPIDVQALDCDFYAFSGHKVFGPTGIGVLYGKLAHLEAMPPYQGGGEMIQTVAFSGTTFNDPPYKFEAGTPHIAGAIGLAAALEFVEHLGYETFGPYEAKLMDYAVEALASISGLRLLGTARPKTGAISFVLDGVHASDLGMLIDLEGVAIRTGHHCAQPLMARFGLSATARASLALYNTQEEIDALVQAIVKAKTYFE